MGGVTQDKCRQLCGCFGHIHGTGKVALCQDRQAPGVIEMGMSYQDIIEITKCKPFGNRVLLVCIRTPWNKPQSIRTFDLPDSTR